MIDAKLKELEKMNNFSPDYLNMLDTIEVSKPIELEEIGSTLTGKNNKKFNPKKYEENERKKQMEDKLPKGKCHSATLVDIISVSF
jgi:hypothetical protein